MFQYYKYSRSLKVVLLACFLLASCKTAPPPPPITNVNATPGPTSQPLVVLLLIDPTSSLTEQENTRVTALTLAMFKDLPAGSKYGIYPIQIAADRVPPLIPDDMVPTAHRTDLDKREYEEKKEVLANIVKTKVKELYKSENRVADDRQSCIINMLGFAERQLKQMSRIGGLDPNQATYRLVIISDMVEECRDSPLGQIRLNKKDIDEEIKLADNYTQLTSPPDLSNVDITVIFPLTDESPLDLSRRPADRDLRAFWEKIFRHVQKNRKNPEHLEWISTGQLPNWFKSILEEKKKSEHIANR
jgi:hypothetical protein